MREGLLWFNDDPAKTLAQKVDLATIAYRRKFGEMPNACYVHISEGQEFEIGGVKVAPLRTVLKHHFWVGKET